MSSDSSFESLEWFFFNFCKHYAIRGYFSALFFNSPQYLMITCRTRELFEIEATIAPEKLGSFNQVCFVL